MELVEVVKDRERSLHIRCVASALHESVRELIERYAEVLNDPTHRDRPREIVRGREQSEFVYVPTGRGVVLAVQEKRFPLSGVACEGVDFNLERLELFLSTGEPSPVPVREGIRTRSRRHVNTSLAPRETGIRTGIKAMFSCLPILSKSPIPIAPEGGRAVGCGGLLDFRNAPGQWPGVVRT